MGAFHLEYRQEKQSILELLNTFLILDIGDIHRITESQNGLG